MLIWGIYQCLYFIRAPVTIMGADPSYSFYLGTAAAAGWVAVLPGLAARVGEPYPPDWDSDGMAYIRCVRVDGVLYSTEVKWIRETD